MKRALLLCLAAVMVLSSTLSFAATKRLTFATGGTAGVYFSLGGVLGQILGEKSDGKLSVTVQTSGASGENMRLLESKEVDIAFSQNDVAHFAYNGLAPFKEKQQNIRAIARIYPEYLQLIAAKGAGVKSVEDFKGKRVSVGDRGSGNEINCRQILQYYGITYKDLDAVFLPYSEAVALFKDRGLDALMFTTGARQAAIVDITTTQDVEFVSFAEDKMDELVKKFPYFVKDTIAANVYKGQTEPVRTLSVQAILVAHKDMSDDDVYFITKTIFENIPDIAKAHNTGAEIGLEKAANGITIPFHPGAEKYLKEKGILK